MSRDKGPPGPEVGEGRANPANVEEFHNSTPTPAATTETGTVNCSGSPRPCTSSQQVNWWSVHMYVASLLIEVGSWPTVGTREWCALDDTDPVKTAALLDAAAHWALRLETCREARCDASREVSEALDWSALAREINQRADFYAARPWLKRVAS